MLAITLDDLESTKLLITRGANINVKNDEGWTGKIKKIILFYSILLLLFV